jgi:hypothetical protein
VLAIVIFPICETILFKLQGDITSSVGNLFWALTTFIVFSHIISGLLCYSFSIADDFYFEYSDLMDKKEEISTNLDQEKEENKALETSRTAVYFAVKALSHFLVYCKSTNNISSGDVNQWVEKVLYVIIQKRSEVLGFKSDSKYNIAVYLYDDDSNSLKNFFRVSDNRISTRNRSLEPGFGHIGLCYLREKAIISPDVQKAPELTGDMSEGDETDYRSIAAAPIFELNPPGETRRARGVFIVTSDKAGQLTEIQHETLLLSLASILSLLFYHADQYKQTGDKYVG